MLEPYPNGSEFRFGWEDQLYTIHLPPPGWRKNYWTGKLEKCGFANANQPLRKQFIPKERMRLEYPKDWKKWMFDEQKMQRSDPDYANPEAEAWRIQEWERRLSGCWFKIYNPITRKAENVYLTGLHYFYCFFWKCDFGIPDFRFIDLEIFYLLQLAEEDPKCNGVVLNTNRRFGKTAILGCWSYEYPSRVPNSYSALQSKNYGDAQKVFSLSIIYPWKNLPEFFRPKFDYQSTQKSELSFKVPPPKGKKAQEMAYEEYDFGLNSYMNFRDSGLYAYDGWKTHRYAGEEPGKTEEVDVYDRHIVVKPCTEVGGKIIGKMFYPSTVEDTASKGLEPFRKLFFNSRITKKNKNGKTETGLFAHFIPAYKGYMFDDQGRSLEQESKEGILNDREMLKDKPQELASLIRKYPFNVDEAFRIGTNVCVFNEQILNDRLSYLNKLPPNRLPYTQGDLAWMDQVDGDVEFIPNSTNGKFLFSWIPDADHRNMNRKASYNEWEPLLDARHGIATDPISHTKTVDPRQSKAAAHGFRKLDLATDYMDKPLEDWKSHNFIFEYLHRPDEVESYFEDMIMACRYLGCQILYESQKNNIGQHFRQRGYSRYLMFRPEATWTQQTGTQNTEGIPASKEMIDMYVMKMKTFINRHGMRIPFPRTLTDLLRFNPQKTTEHDLAVSSCWTLMALEKIVEATEIKVEADAWFDVFDATGSRSQLKQAI